VFAGHVLKDEHTVASYGTGPALLPPPDLDGVTDEALRTGIREGVTLHVVQAATNNTLQTETAGRTPGTPGVPAGPRPPAQANADPMQRLLSGPVADVRDAHTESVCVRVCVCVCVCVCVVAHVGLMCLLCVRH
jgi:hypothetical protein